MKIQTLARRIPLTRGLRNYVHDHVRSVLQRFTTNIAAIQVELRDKNGRRGGGDKRCRIRVQIACGVPVLVEEEQASIRTAIRHAASRAAAHVQAALRRAR
jgi:putative sigma-54 modulation protein